MKTITCGVPQGSTLGPLLFLLYINDLPNSSEKLSFRIFADDTNIFFTGSNPNEVEFTMNEEIKLVLKHCAIYKLSVNFKKTNYMLISSSKKKMHLNIHNIDCKSYIKYLGIYLDELLQWEPQIQHVNNNRFPGKRNLTFHFRFSFTHVIGKRNSRLRFRFPTTLKMEFELG